MENLSSTNPAAGAKKVGDRCFTENRLNDILHADYGNSQHLFYLVCRMTVTHYLTSRQEGKKFFFGEAKWKVFTKMISEVPEQTV